MRFNMVTKISTLEDLNSILPEANGESSISEVKNYLLSYPVTMYIDNNQRFILENTGRLVNNGEKISGVFLIPQNSSVEINNEDYYKHLKNQINIDYINAQITYIYTDSDSIYIYHNGKKCIINVYENFGTLKYRVSFIIDNGFLSNSEVFLQRVMEITENYYS